jgi:hypothetical protein
VRIKCFFIKFSPFFTIASRKLSTPDLRFLKRDCSSVNITSAILVAVFVIILDYILQPAVKRPMSVIVFTVTPVPELSTCCIIFMLNNLFFLDTFKYLV